MNRFDSNSKSLTWAVSLLLAAVMAGCGGGGDPILGGGAGTGAAGPAGINTAMLGTASTYGIAATAGVTNTTTAPITIINGNVVLDPVAGATCNARGS